MIKIGSHVSLSGDLQFLGSVEEMLSYQANVLMVYTGAPQSTIRRPLSELRIEEARSLLQKNGLSGEDVIVHAPYIVNLANPDPMKQDFAVSFLTEEVKRTSALGSKVMVLHPGAHMNEGSEAGVKRIAKGVNQIISNTKGLDVIIALEGMAGKGTEVGRTFEELKGIITLIDDQSRIGVCLDTCHLNDAGYDVRNQFDDVINQFDQIVGRSYLKVFHINDSKNPLGSHKDRHENIGFGTIGFSALSYVIHHPLLKDIPKILETPYVSSVVNDKKSYPPYLYEIEALRNNKEIPELIEKVIQANEGV
ncbi:MAG: deoxyribonuclease IV [Candidatus Izemoplasmatales bacterium]